MVALLASLFLGGNPIPAITPTPAPMRVIVVNSASIGVGSGSGLTDAELRAADVEITLDGEVVPVTGTFFQATQPVSAAALPLPAGAATSASQLPDGHNVTVDNAAGASAVNVQDGGNSLTVDYGSGTFVVGDGAGALNVIVDSATLGTVTVSDGAGALNTIIDSGSVTVSDGSGALNVIVDSATLGTVTVSDGAGALNTIIDSGTVTTVSTVTAVTSITNTVTAQPASTSTVEIDGSCPSGAVSFTVISAAAGRKVLYMWASPANTANVAVKFGTTADATDALLAPGQPLNSDAGKTWDGRVDAFPISGTQAVCVVAW